MIKDEQIIKVIAEATGNRYDPKSGPVTNTLGWRQYSNAGNVAAKLNKEFGLSLTSMEILNCPNIAAVLILVANATKNKNNSFQQQTYGSNRFSTTSKNEMLNIIITGKSGAGKSSFLNYLIGKEHFKVGEGSPVTQAYFEDYIYQAPETGVKYHLYDTKGIEPTTTTECRNVILNEIKKRDNLNLFEWIHTVYYCFDASAKRIQPFEINFINELKRNVSIIILLTKKDLVPITDLNNLVSQIEKEVGTNVQVVPVCSVEQRTRKRTSHREGKEEVLRASFLGLWEKLANSRPRHIVEPITREYPFLLNNSQITFDFIEIIFKALPTYFKNDAKNKKLSIDFLCNFPLKENLGGEYIVVSLMNEVNDYIKLLFRHLSVINVDSIWNENEIIHRDIFNFYQKVNRVKPRVLYSDMAKDSLRAIANYDIQGKQDRLVDLTSKIQKLYQEVNDTWFFDAEERLDVTNCFYRYRDLVMKIGIELNLLINNFLTSYRAELMQYGQYCLKKEVKKEEIKVIDSEGELSFDERTYYDVVMACLEDRKINDAERFMLNQLLNVLAISPTRGGLIEDFARKNIKR